ncbi:lecithin retinol acyltransferase family protein [Selenomonas ruminantium]|uniref:lecithin retinol acyltransferase family protein n=1 Tax=Selenomonas ruminantium TaxID=971 RepID=UPI00047D64C6|nr:lecithin retinol acyltransferase family protein [Selenomonas ruminantium]
MQKPQKGDMIFTTRFAYNHYGIYSGRNKVIHYCKIDGSCCDGEIRETSLDEFLDGDTLHICKFDRNFFVGIGLDLIDCALMTVFGKLIPDDICRRATLRFRQEHRDKNLHIFTPETVVSRAKSKIGTHDYNLFGNNYEQRLCEHFAMWCKTGIPISAQVDLD